jgi:hypothetical protein
VKTPKKKKNSTTPGDSKQHRSETEDVLWHEVCPLVEHPELILVLRPKRSLEDKEEKGNAEANNEKVERAVKERILACIVVHMEREQEPHEMNRRSGVPRQI